MHVHVASSQFPSAAVAGINARDALKEANETSVVFDLARVRLEGATGVRAPN